MTRRDYWIVLAAFGIGFAMLLPHLLFTRSLGDRFQGVYDFVNEDTPYYVARVRDVLEGHWLLGNPYLAEHKDRPPMQFFFPDWLAAAPLALFGVPAAPGILWSTLFWVPLNILLFYQGLVALTRSRFWSFLAAAGLFAGFFLRAFNRPVSPQAVMPFWFLLFWLMARWFWAIDYHQAARATADQASPPTRSHAVIAALVFGALFYVYPYAWTFYAALFAVLFVIGFFFKNVPRLAMLGVLGGGFLIGSLYFLFLFSARRLPEYGESLTRLGMISTHFPSGVAIVAPAAALLGLYLLQLWRRGWQRSDARTLLVVGGLVAIAGVVNQHLLTGKNLEFSSHYSDISWIWFAIAIAYFMAGLETRFPSRRRVLLRCSAVLLALVLVAPRAFALGRSTVGEASVRTAHLQRYGPVLRELDRRVALDDVVFANAWLSLLAPVYTPANVFFDRHANLFFISDAEVRDRFLLHHYFDDVDAALLREQERAVWGVRYIDQAGHARQQNKLREFLGLTPVPVPTLPPGEIEATLGRFRELRQSGFERELKRYRVHWLVWDRLRDPRWVAVETLPFLEKVTEVGDFAVYRVR